VVGREGVGTGLKKPPPETLTSKPQFWVLGLEPCLNNYSSSFFTFDMLMRGRYFPERSEYLIDSPEEKPETPAEPDTSASESPLSAQPLLERSYIFIPHVFNQNMFKIKIKEFFRQAKMERFYFDIGNKEGVCILLLDELTSGTISLMTVGTGEHETVNQIKSVLEFVARVSVLKNVDYGRNENEPSTDKILFKDMLNLFMSMVRKDQRAGSKARALK
jgi:hypothetical protein